MSRQSRPVPTSLLICDLCNEEIDTEHPGERGSLTHGFIAHKVVVPATKWAWLHWPPAGRERGKPWEWKRQPENRERAYDFHADCILRLVEANLFYPIKTDQKEA
jgi:hypothetical protein